MTTAPTMAASELPCRHENLQAAPKKRPGTAHLIMPDEQEAATCRECADWVLLALEKNPRASYPAMRAAYEQSDFYSNMRRITPLHEDVFEYIQNTVKAGRQAVAVLRAHLAHARKVRQRLERSTSWEDWAHLYISENPTKSAVDVCHAMAHATYGRTRILHMNEKLGDCLGIERIEALQAKVGAGGMTLERHRERRARRDELARLRKASRRQRPRVRALKDALFFQALLERKEGRRDPRPSPFRWPLRKESLSVSTREFFARFQVPEALWDFLERHSYDQEVEFGALVFDAVNSFVTTSLETDHAFIKRCSAG